VDVVITHGRKIVSDEVRALTEEKVRHVGEHCPVLERAEVHFSEEHNPRIADRECCEVVMEGHGHTIRAKASGPTPLIGVDRVVEKLEHQIERTKGRVVGRSQPRHRMAATVSLYRKVRTA
jgi:ribosomal subunit interface protein